MTLRAHVLRDTFIRAMALKRLKGSGWISRTLPEAIALAALGAGLQTGWLLALFLPALLRAAIQTAVAAHELGHAWIAGRATRSAIPLPEGLMAIRALLPFQPIYIPGISRPAASPVIWIGSLSPARRRWSAAAGPAANAVLASLLIVTLLTADALPALLSTALFASLAVNLWVLATSWTDYATAWRGEAPLLYCGNFGILGERGSNERGFLPRRFRRLTKRLGEATDIRGQQAGGLAVMSATGRFVGRKIVNDKRGDLTQALLASFRRRLLLRRLVGSHPQPGILHLIGHHRYGTSSAPSVIETHWHRWQRPRRLPTWGIEDRTLVCRRRVVETLITHNGDFSSWKAPWGSLTVAALGRWLAEVLGEAHPAQGDSPKIAGMMDLLNTQGRWGASLRLAFAMQRRITAPKWYLKELTRVAEQVFARWTAPTTAGESTDEGPAKLVPSVVGCASLAEVYATNPAAVKQLVEALWQASLQASREWQEDTKGDIRQALEQAVEAFFLNDLYRATQLFMAGAQGTFGLVATTSLQPGAIALAADRQPLFIGADPENGLLIYASEAAALKVAGEPDREGWVRPIPFRCDLRDGDIALLQVVAGTADNTITLVNRYRDDAPVVERITTERLAASAGATLGTAADAPTATALRWVTLTDNPLITPASGRVGRRRRRDRVLNEMSDIPRVLALVRRVWDDPASPNRQTAASFVAEFFARSEAGKVATAPTGAPSRVAGIDVLLLGVENSLYLAERFANDLARVFPYLRVEAVDAVRYCEDPNQFHVGPETITLALSHSGQTFNTLDAVKFVNALHALGKAGPVFVMTGEVDTLMGAAVGQQVYAGAPWQARVFDTAAGWRTAEPATVSTAAMHATLTELLLLLMRQALARRGDAAPPFGFAASASDVQQIDALARFAIPRAEAVLGCTAEGWKINNSERDALLGQGRDMARMLTEPALVFLFTAVHLFAMVWLGWNPVVGLGELLSSTTDLAFVDAGTQVGKFLLVVLQTVYFLFAGVLFALLLRWLQRRPLLDRLYVGRTLVIGDDAWVKDLLSQYVSKLFSLAYEFAGFASIHAADARSGELLHSYGHRVTRGLILFLGLPDGRWAGRERAEAAVCMTSCQVRGVQNLGSGAIVFGVGHNPACADKIDHFTVLGGASAPAESVSWVLRSDWSALARKLQESRFSSFERLLSAYVVFHNTAARTRDFMNRLVPIANLVWAPAFLLVRLLTGGRVRPRFSRWDLSRTQSGTRIATTAAPVSAYDKDPNGYVPLAERYAGFPLAAVPCPDALPPPPFTEAIKVAGVGGGSRRQWRR